MPPTVIIDVNRRTLAWLTKVVVTTILTGVVAYAVYGWVGAAVVAGSVLVVLLALWGLYRLIVR
ncbi:hypothetical protein [Allokutzneria oryzae]|uniref:Uncharacterized protein n=1 Tax=Allokutzneria oryzae TaxID=1378989 RepID=A0ABV6ABS2_9PSEU